MNGSRTNWLSHLRRSLWVRRLAGAIAAGTAIVLVPLPPSGGLPWDIGIGVGYAAVVFASTLYLYPVRGDGLPHRRLFTLSQHRRIGWIALILSALHIAILLIAQPLTSRYLLPSAPLYMLAGTLALIALAILIATGLSARSTLRSRSSGKTASVSTHAILAALFLALVGAHVIGSHQLADTRVKALTTCLLLAIPLCWAALRSTRGRRQVRRGDLTRAVPPQPSVSLASSIQVPTHSASVTPRLLTTTLPCCAAVVLLLLLPLPTATSRLLAPATTPPLLPIRFPHEKHTTVNCVICHHNFIDKTGIGSCLDCHRRPNPALPQSAEATFHTFCRDCHDELAHTAAKHGPTRACSDCHAKPDNFKASDDNSTVVKPTAVKPASTVQPAAS